MYLKGGSNKNEHCSFEQCLYWQEEGRHCMAEEMYQKIDHINDFVSAVYKQQRVLLDQLMQLRFSMDEKFETLIADFGELKEMNKNIVQFNELCEKLCLLSENKRVYSTMELAVMKESYSWSKLSEVTDIPVSTLRRRIKKYYERQVLNSNEQ